MRRNNGTGSITKKGYIRINNIMEHRRIWEECHGIVPIGYLIHHIDGNKQNNDISNLQLIDSLTHKRIHSNCEIRDGEWWKPCRKCGEVKQVSTNYYKHKPNGISPWCKSCCIKYSTNYRNSHKLVST